jgi:hypothetical protein
MDSCFTSGSDVDNTNILDLLKVYAVSIPMVFNRRPKMTIQENFWNKCQIIKLLWKPSQAYTFPRFFVLVWFFISTGVWTQTLPLDRQALYYFTHAPSPFLLYFWIGSFFLLRAGLGPLFYLCLSHSRNYRCMPSHLDYWLRWQNLTNFLSRLASNLHPPHMYFPSTWD